MASLARPVEIASRDSCGAAASAVQAQALDARRQGQARRLCHGPVGPGLELPEAVDVVGLQMRPVDTWQLIELLVDRARHRLRTTACYANAHTVNLSRRDPRLWLAMTGCDVLFADGASVVWASRWSRRRLPERITAMDYFPRLAWRCAERDVSIYLLGGRPGVAERAADRLRNASPGLAVVGAHHGHFEPADSDRVVREINATGADLLAVGMSSPRQECWLQEHARALRPPVRLCVGALFDYLAGVERRGPQWLCDAGGEWLYRLIVDPAGKWRRYVLGNPVFLWNVLRWRRAMRRGHAASRGTSGRANTGGDARFGGAAGLEMPRGLRAATRPRRGVVHGNEVRANRGETAHAPRE